MKVESTKSENQIPKEKKTKILSKVDAAVNSTSESIQTSNQPKKDFAAILNDISDQNHLRSENQNLEKRTTVNTLEEFELEANADQKDKRSIRDEKRDKSNSGNNSEPEPDRSFGDIQVKQRILGETNIPNGRVILHVADLERIISKIRSQTVAGGKQITIELKRSVFEGLKLQLTFGKDKGVIAEFIAANESVKTQLNSRSDELADLLKNRGVKLNKILISVNENDRKDQNQTDMV